MEGEEKNKDNDVLDFEDEKVKKCIEEKKRIGGEN